MVRAGVVVTLLPLSLLLLSFLSSGSAAVDVHKHRSNSTAQRPVFLRAGWTESHKIKSLCELGRGKGIVFSPDLSEPGNREFFQALGFAYFEDADWHKVLQQVKAYNKAHRESPIEVLLIQSHGTNGDGLKLQTSNQAAAPRSYISAGGLLENLENSGVRICLLAACNAGRLLRPENFHEVKASEGNRLFEPATLGIISSTAEFDPADSTIAIGRRAESHIEVINECRIAEFAPNARTALIAGSNGRLKAATRIAVPEMLIQLLVDDEHLKLVSEGFELERSFAETNDGYREHLITEFLRFINGVADRERVAMASSTVAE
ncbi:MAG TPA: hypothetical protein VN643_17825 [Pyrinomonadaceae bacterium]|nr:hypothetical protein [Pyrinomonadaceae bacterium]